uniref:C2H2-type domain-containing protein n=1 Tax=Steinernema glaseri TaxID=37863 RepID=A0A1I8AKD3_9BILA
MHQGAEEMSSEALLHFMSALEALRFAFSQIDRQSDIQKALEAILCLVESIKTTVKERDEPGDIDSLLQEESSRAVAQEAEELIHERLGSGWCTDSQLSWIDNASGDLVTALYDQVLAEESEASTSAPVEEATKDRPYECAECGFSTRSRTGFWRHAKKTGHRTRAERSPPEKRVFRCDLCFLQCSQKSNLTRHYRRCHGTDERNFACEQCPKRFKEQEALKTHVHVVHGKGEKLHKCDFCKGEKHFTSTSNLLRHIRTVHLEVRTSRSSSSRPQ